MCVCKDVKMTIKKNKKYMENIEENMHAEIGALRVKGEQTKAI